MQVLDRADLPRGELAELTLQVGPFATLAQILRWGLEARPPFEVEEIVVQDEYTHDVVFRWRAGRYLVFDST